MERDISTSLYDIIGNMDKIMQGSKIPIGYISNTERKVIDYYEHRQNIYIIECQKCFNVINGASKTLHNPCKKCSYIKNTPLQDLRKQIYYKYKYNANIKNVKFDITFNYFCEIISKDCYLCGQPPSRKWNANRKKDNFIIYNGVDRKINELGYTEKNCAACCSECNYIKKDKSIKDFKELVSKWSERFEKW